MLRTVETYDGAPLSYMTEEAARLLAELATLAELVPATTRTRAQYRRIQLPGPTPGWVPKYAISANGGHLLVNGQTDHDWHATITASLAANCAPLDEIVAHLAETSDPEWVHKQDVAEDLFAYMVVERPKLPAGWLAELAGWAAARGWRASLQLRKVYLVPQPLTKSAALAEVASRTGAQTILAAGDSLLDADLLQYADAAFRPGHGELAHTGWTAPGVTALTETGVVAGEELLRRMLALVREEGDRMTQASERSRPAA